MFRGYCTESQRFLGAKRASKVDLESAGEWPVAEDHREGRGDLVSYLGFNARLMTLKTMQIRPLVSGAILRNITFTKESYASFISLQDKLHQNLARQRTLVSIGTHDLDTIQGPFTYEALPPEQIKFIPLNQTKEMNGAELMAFYEVRVLFLQAVSTELPEVELSASRKTSTSGDIFTSFAIPPYIR